MNLNFVNYINLTLDEHKALLRVRNFDYVRTNMIDDSLILMDNHLAWIKKLANDPTKKYYAIFSDNELLGGINITNIDMNNKTSSWGLFMKEHSNPMIPSIATYMIIDKIFGKLNLETLNLEVNKNNTNAYKFDKNFGFKDIGEHDNGKNRYFLMKMHKNEWEEQKKKALLKIIKKKIDTSTITFKD